MGQEFELKFAANEAAQDQIRSGYGPWEMLEMQTTYYDTPSRCLSQHHITLRQRMENGISVCTVKTPRTDGSRGEWECNCHSVEAAVPQLCQLGAPEYIEAWAAEGLQAVCGARFTRYACRITLDHAVAELALDKGVLSGGSREIPLCEVEVELKSGSRDAICTFAAALAAKMGLVPEPKSKFRRAMELNEGV